MLYAYSAVTADGRRVRGRLEAANPADLEMRLKHMALDLIHGKPVTRHALSNFLAAVPRRERISFCFQLQQLIQAGVPLQESLQDLSGAQEHPRMQEIVASLVKRIEGGQTLSQALSAHPEFLGAVFVSLIRAGELSGDLSAVLEKLCAALKWEDELVAHSRKLLFYPAFAACVTLFSTTFLMLYLVPQLKQFVASMGQTLPFYARLLFFVSDFLLAYGHVFLLILLLGAGAVYALWRASPQVRYRLDALKLRLPILGGIFRKIALARFADTFAMLYAAGIPVLESLRITRDVVANRVIHQALAQIEAAIREGRNMASAFEDTGLFPPLVVRMARVGENTGALDRALQNVSYFYSRDARESVERAQTLIEPLLTLALGAVLGWIVLSVIGPIYDIISQFKV
jgi:type IV pilus assembly protein PilC